MSRPPLTGVDSFLLDKTDYGQLKSVILRLSPEVVVDTGALHNVDYCETHAQEAYEVNARGTAKLAELCRGARTKYLFVSTDYIFDGVKGMYEEYDPPNPLSVYGMSKLEGEQSALKQDGLVTVVRPSVIFSWDSNPQTTSTSGKPLNFGMWLFTQLRASKAVKIVSDQVASPTLADDLAASIIAVVEAGVSGVFHTGGKTAISRYDFAVKLARKFDFDRGLITPISTPELKQVAKRPMNSSLVSKRIEREVGHAMMDVDRALEIFREQSDIAERGA
jgi:dTDP-4-dehydrorhamnose reductase